MTVGGTNQDTEHVASIGKSGQELSQEALMDLSCVRSGSAPVTLLMKWGVLPSRPQEGELQSGCSLSPKITPSDNSSQLSTAP